MPLVRNSLSDRTRHHSCGGLGSTAPDVIKLKNVFSFPFIQPFPTLQVTWFFFPQGWEGCLQWAGVNGRRGSFAMTAWWCWWMHLHHLLPRSSCAFFPSLLLLKSLPATKVWGTARLWTHTCSTNCSSDLEVWTLTDGNGFQLISLKNMSDA